MESRRRPRSSGGSKEKRVRTNNLVIRLSDTEREMLDELASRMELTISDTFRYLVRREHEKGKRRPQRQHEEESDD